MIKEILRDYHKYPKTLGYKLPRGQAGLELEDEALKSPRTSWQFAKCIEYADINKLEQKASEDSYYSYYFARTISQANVENLINIAQKSPFISKLIAFDINTLNISNLLWATDEYSNYVLSVGIKQFHDICKGTKHEFQLDDSQHIITDA